MKDVQAEFSAAQAITATAASTNFINLGLPKTAPGAPAATKRDLGTHQAIEIQVVEAFGTLTSLTVNVEMDDNSSFSSPKTVATTGAIPLAKLTLGAILPISQLPLGSDEQYLRLNYVVAGTDADAGKITSGLVTGSVKHV
jgi:hypothetical protein